MEAFYPSISLIIWTILYIISFGVGILALIRLYRNDQLDVVSKLLWTGWIISIPIFGSLFYNMICEPDHQRTAQ